MKKVKNEKCSIWWCNNPHYALGYCKPHYQANLRYGHPYGKHRAQLERIDTVIKASRYVAQGVTEFAKTEFGPTEFAKKSEKTPVAVWSSHDITDNMLCPFCNEKYGEHDEYCIVRLSRFILDSTLRCSEKG